MELGPAEWSAGAAILALIASSIWAHYRFADFERLPRHFGPNLKPTAYGPRGLMIWVTPAIFVALLVLLLVLPRVVPPEYINGDPQMGAIIASAVLVAAQGFILWLLTRWANGPEA